MRELAQFPTPTTAIQIGFFSIEEANLSVSHPYLFSKKINYRILSQMSSKLGQNGRQKANDFASADSFEKLLMSEVVCYDRISSWL